MEGNEGESIMRAFIALLVAGVVAVAPLSAQQPVSLDVETAAMRQVAAAIPLGSRVKVQTRSGRRLTATMLGVEADAIVVKRDARVPEPAVTIPFSEVAQLQRDQKSGFNLAKALGIGIAAGAGAILTMFAIAMSLD
jgi:hypothetical protein